MKSCLPKCNQCDSPRNGENCLRAKKGKTVMACVFIPLIAALLGYFLGKYAIDRLVDSNVAAFLHTVLVCGASAVIIVLSIVFWKPYRIPCAVALVVFLGAVVTGFLFCVFYNSTLGLKVKWDDSVGVIVKDLVYDENRPETGYDLYLPSEKTNDGTYALVLYVHGGGFTSGSKKDGELWCKYMTAKGYVSASIDYTLQGNQENPSNLHLMAQQVVQCVAAARDKCSQLGYELSEMAVTGGSAGGAIAALFAYGYAEESAVPLKFIFQQTGPMYFDPIWWGAANYDYAMQAMFISNFSGQKVTEEMIQAGEHQAIIDAMSPAALVREDSVPMLCAYGPRDQMVPERLKYHLFEALEKYHVPYTFVEYPHSNHGLYDDPAAQREYLKQVDEFCRTYFEHKPKNN